MHLEKAKRFKILDDRFAQEGALVGMGELIDLFELGGEPCPRCRRIKASHFVREWRKGRERLLIFDIETKCYREVTTLADITACEKFLIVMENAIKRTKRQIRAKKNELYQQGKLFVPGEGDAKSG